MNKMSLPPVGAAMVSVGTPTFAELLDRLTRQTELSATRSRDLASSLRRVSAALGLDPSHVYAHMAWLQPRIASVSFRAIGLKAKTWSNLLSDCRAAMVILDRAKPRANRRGVLIPVWRSLWEELIARDSQKSIERSVGSFVFYLSRIGVVPGDVTNEHALMFREELMANQIRKSPDETYRRAIAGWNRAVLQWPFWPRQKLSAPSRLKVIRISRNEVPLSFFEDLERFLEGLARPDPFDEVAILKPLRPASIKSYRDHILLFAGALVRSGADANRITSIADLVGPTQVRQGLTWLIIESGSESKKHHFSILRVLVATARRHVRSGADDMKMLEDMLSRLKRKHPRQRGMTEKNLERIRPLRDEVVLKRLLCLPENLFARGEALGNTPQGLILQRDALLLAVLRNHPIRRRNLIEIQLDKHIVRTGTQGAYLVFSHIDVKNQRSIEFEISPELLALIDRHLAKRTPILCPKGTPWLFSNRSGTGHLHESYVSTRISDCLRRELGLAFNPHLARHTAAFVYLSQRPGQYEAVRRLLGHSSTSSTLDVYASFETDSVGREYSAFVSRSMELGKKGGGKK